MAEKIERLAMKITAVIAAIAVVVSLGALFRDGSLKAAEADITAEITETVSPVPEVVVEELTIELP